MGRHDLGEPQRRFLRDPGGIALPSLVQRSRRLDQQRLGTVARRLGPGLPGLQGRYGGAGARRGLRGTRKRCALYLDLAWHCGHAHPGQPPRAAPEGSPRGRAQTRGCRKCMPLPRDAPAPRLRPRADHGTDRDTGPRQDLDCDLSYLGLVEILYGYFTDAVRLTPGCDKPTPGAIMAPSTVDIPAIVLS